MVKDASAGSTSLVSRPVVIEGEISGDENLHVDGRVKGIIRLTGDLFVGASVQSKPRSTPAISSFKARLPARCLPAANSKCRHPDDSMASVRRPPMKSAKARFSKGFPR